MPRAFMLCHTLSLLLSFAWAEPASVCDNRRCDSGACPCGCECGTAADPGLCYAPPAFSGGCLGEQQPTILATRAMGHTGQRPTVLVTGATGRTGVHLYKLLVADGTYTVRAFVRDVHKARALLGCHACDQSEGIFVGNVSDDAALRAAAHGAQAVAIAVGVGGVNITQKEAEAVELFGVQKQAAALAQPDNLKGSGGPGGLRVVLCSSMGTTMPSPPPMAGGSILFWKLNAEAYLAATGLSIAIVKPCGLLSVAGRKSTLLVGKNDELFGTMPPVVAREDVARVMAAALTFDLPRHAARAADAPPPLSLRFDLCSKHGAPTTDLQALLEQTKFPWQRGSQGD